MTSSFHIISDAPAAFGFLTGAVVGGFACCESVTAAPCPWGAAACGGMGGDGRDAVETGTGIGGGAIRRGGFP